MKKKKYLKSLRILKNTLYTITLILIVFIMTTSTKTLAETPANLAFIDYNFYKCVVDRYNDVNDTSLPYTTNLTDEQLQTITILDCSGYGKTESEKITSASGVEKLTSLVHLYLDDNNLSSIDVSHNPDLTNLHLSYNNLSSIDVSHNSVLTNLHLSYNNLSSIDVSHNSVLTTLYLPYNNLSSIDLSHNPDLTYLSLYENNLSSIDLSTNTALIDLSLNNNDFNSIKLNSNIIGLLNNKYFDLNSIDFGNNRTLLVSSKLQYMYNSFIAYNGETPNVNQFLNEITVNNLTLKVYNGDTEVTSGNIEEGYKLKILSGTTVLQELEIKLYNGISFDDYNFYKCIVDEYNDVNDTSLPYTTNLTNAQLQTIVIFACDSYDKIESEKIASVSGIEKLTNLTDLYLSHNNLSSIDLSHNTKLTDLDLFNNNLSSIDVSHNTDLTRLDLHNNNISSIDVSHNTDLTLFFMFNNNLSSIDLGYNTALVWLDLDNNNLSSIDVSSNTNIIHLWLAGNNLSSINLSQNTKLTSLLLFGNNLSSIDLSANTLLEDLDLSDNPLSLGTVRIIKGSSTKPSVILPNAFPITYTINDSSIASYSNGQISGLKIGTTNITGTFNNNSKEINVSGTIKVFDITSTKYNVNKSDGYIFTGTDTGNIILDNVNIPVGVGSVSGNKLQLKDGEILVEEYDIVSYNSSTYDLNQNYINAGTGSVNLDNITVINGTKNISGNKLQIKYGTTVLKEYDIVSYNSSTYDLNQNNVIVNPDDDNTDILNNITVSNCTKEMTSGKLVIKYEGTTIKEYNIAKLNPGTLSSNLDMNKGIIKGITVGSKVSSLNGITVTGGTISKLDKNNNSILDTANLKTGDKLRITFSDNSYYDYTVSVKGDVDGSGTLTLTDIMKIANYVYKDQTKLVGAYLVSADYNGDGNYLLSDIMTLAHQVYKGED